MTFFNKPHLLFISIFCFASILSYGQPKEDSLVYVANSTSVDSIKFIQYFKLVKGFKFYDLEKTKQYTDSIAAIYHRVDNPKYKGISDYYYGFYYRKKDDYERAIDYYQKAKQYGVDKNYLSLYAVSISEIAGIYIDQGVLAKALEINIEAADFNKQAADHNREARLNNNYNAIGLIYGQMGEYDYALDYYRKSIKVAPTDEDESVPYGNMAEIFLAQNKIDSLNIYAEKCFQIEDKYKNPRGLAYAEWLRAEAFFKAGKFKLAEKSGVESIALYRKYPEKILMIDAYRISSKALAKNNKIHLAIEYAKEGISLASEIGNFELQAKGQKILASIYEDNGSYDLALKHFKIYTSNLDSLDYLKENDKLQDLAIKYEMAQKSEKISAQKLELVNQNSQKNTLLGSLVLLSLLSIFLFYRFKSKQKISNQEIVLLKQEKKLLAIDYIVQGQEEERKRIAQDLHDGLGGILSTAKIQMKKIQGEIEKLEDLNLVNNAQVLIDFAYKEVRRISHDMMPGALVNLGLFAAIEDLAAQINLHEDLKIKTQWYTSDDDIPEGIQPIIYRIVQETITNAVKYAKANKMLIQMTNNDDAFNLTIEDDGLGFDMAKSREGIGIKNIKSRVNYLNGEIEIISKPNQGTVYEIVFPY